MSTLVRAALLASLVLVFSGCGGPNSLPTSSPAAVHRNDSGGAMTGDDSGGAMTGDNPGGNAPGDSRHHVRKHHRT
jgi:predicted small lipoprotein YifL